MSNEFEKEANEVIHDLVEEIFDLKAELGSYRKDLIKVALDERYCPACGWSLKVKK